jgi:type IX secretion system PorP/SprF family membrane protein
VRKFSFLIICIFFITGAFGQQKPHYTQYLINQYIINPAITGIENYTDIRLSHRLQWSGLTDAPVTSYFTFHTPINKSDFRTSATSFEPRTSNPRGIEYWDKYSAPEPHHGLGIQILNDRTGPINRFSAYATYAYHTPLSVSTSLSVGFGAGITNTSLNADKLEFAQGSVDPAVYGSGKLNSLTPDANVGLYLYSRNHFIGVAVQQVIPQKVEFADGIVRTVNGKQVPHFFLHGGYRISAGPDFNVTPSFMVKTIGSVEPQFDLNLKVQYLDVFWLGTGLRIKEGFSGLAGFNIAKTVNLSYSYDFTSTPLNNFSKGSHEIILGFVIGKYGDTCPRNIW